MPVVWLTSLNVLTPRQTYSSHRRKLFKSAEIDGIQMKVSGVARGGESEDISEIDPRPLRGKTQL
jgi:hypothetical protein